MCLLGIAWQCRRDYPLVVVANRDEFHARPAAPMQFWPDQGIWAGRDLEAGGTWFAAADGGRFAAVTNIRDASLQQAAARSRGELPLAVIKDGTASPSPELYSGFNLIWGGPDDMHYLATGDTVPSTVEPGVHCLSNHRLNTPWPKVKRLDRCLAEAVASPGAPSVDGLFELLRDSRPAADEDLPDTGVGLDRERLLSPAFVVSPDYGTRCSTVFVVASDGTATLAERRFDRKGRFVDEDRFRLPARGAYE